MIRRSTAERVRTAVMEIARDSGPEALTMEGIAERAGVGKQTLYREWPSSSSVIFDTLLARSTGPDGRVAVPDTGDLRTDLVTLLGGAVEEMYSPPVETLLRHLAARIQLDERVAAEYRLRLLEPQSDAVRDRLRSGGVADPETVEELLLAPVLRRWFLRAPAPGPERLRRLVELALATEV